MNIHSLQLRSFRIILSTVLLFLLFMTTSENARSQSNFTYPQVPRLSLCGAEDGYNVDWYPDGRIWLPVTKRDGAPREFLMPVFIDNKWYHYTGGSSVGNLGKFLVPDPIYSFKFKIVYDGVAITPVDIVTLHPFPDDDARATNIRGNFTPPLAEDFNINWHIDKDTTYRSIYFNYPGDPEEPGAQEADRRKGRVIIISGSSTKPLPTTDTAAIDFSILLYVKFRINLEQGSIDADDAASQRSQLYISMDTIMYNDWNVRKEIAFKDLLYSDSVNILDKYNDPNLFVNFVGLAGMNNHSVSSLWRTFPVLPGTIELQLTDALPSFSYYISRPGGSVPAIWDNLQNPEVPEDMWILRDPLTVDSGKVHKDDGFVYGSQKITMLNGSPETRLVDVYVESDAPWLTFRLECTNRSKFVQISPTQGYIYYMDNSILGEGADKPDPLGGLTDPDEVMELTVNCDPDLIEEFNGEKAGIYTGYITFRSHTADISPLRFQITFINFRNPAEPTDGRVDEDGGFTNQLRGITLKLMNSKGDYGEETKLVFGTGHRATDGADTLFGEYPYASAYPLDTSLHARWYHPDELRGNELGVPFGYGDMLPNIIDHFSESRDIRDINDTAYSHVYLCRFHAGGANNYPVVVEWDTTDFPEGAQLYMSDTLHGALFPSVNMRNSTHVSGNVLSYSIKDPIATSFKIEYTQPRIVNYIDVYGNPRIKKGWNLLSLPVRPKSLQWNVIYPNAVNKPYYYYGAGWLNDELLKPGIGYLIKYSDLVDKQFKGVPMKRITKDVADDGFGDEVKIYPGWNTIGALSFPMSYTYIDFDEFNGTKPTKTYVRAHGVWGYKTDIGYYEASILEPGMGYWIKSDSAKHGYLRLVHPEITRIDEEINFAKQNTLNSSAQLVIRDNAQHETNLYLTNDKNVDLTNYELPPVPPAELFDARFNTNTILESDNSTIIKLQGIDYPVSLALNNADANYTFVDAYTGFVLGNIVKGEKKSIEIKNTASNSIKVLKSDVVNGGLSVTNYPNPVTTSSTVRYSVPTTGFVSLKLYDAIGNSVTLFEGNVTAGDYTLPLDASFLASGSYICKLTSGANSTNVIVTIVK